MTRPRFMAVHAIAFLVGVVLAGQIAARNRGRRLGLLARRRAAKPPEPVVNVPRRRFVPENVTIH